MAIASTAFSSSPVFYVLPNTTLEHVTFGAAKAFQCRTTGFTDGQGGIGQAEGEWGSVAASGTKKQREYFHNSALKGETNVPVKSGNWVTPVS